MQTLYPDTIREYINDYLDNFVEEFDTNSGREDILDRLHELADDLFGEMVRYGRLDEYGVDELKDTAQDCATIIEYAETHAWVADDAGLWEGLTYGVLAAIAFHSLENCLYAALEKRGIDTNNDFPFQGVG